jgi:hypothetical protein
MSQGNVSVTVKRKNVAPLFDYCLDNRIEFNVKPSVTVMDEFDIEFVIEDIKKAIAFGMFLKEIKIELNGMAAASAPKNVIKKPAVKEAAPAKEEAPASMVFEENTISFDLEAN